MFNKQRKIGGNDYDPSSGGDIAFVQEPNTDNPPEGYGVEFDTFFNNFPQVSSTDPGGKGDEHIGIIKDRARNHKKSVVTQVDPNSNDPNADDPSNRARITITTTSVEVRVIETDSEDSLDDSEPVLTYEESDGFETGFSNVGFAAATGADTDEHIISDVKLTGNPV